jgi:hypothetical protein
MRPRYAVLQIPSESSVPQGLLHYNERPLLTHSESTLLQRLIPLHFNSRRINTYKKPGRGSPLSAPKFCNSSLPAPHYTHAKQHEPVSFTSFTSSTSFASPSVTPFPATLTSHLQLVENAAALSPAFATLTRRVKHKSFVCHSYKKHPGWGGPRQSRVSSSLQNLPTLNCQPTVNFILLPCSAHPGAIHA